MSLFYQHTINGNTLLGVWKIEEPESFFLQKVPLQRQISHPHKRLQHLAGRYLLQHLFPDFPYELIRIADTRKPFLSNEAYHFSISHCGDFAAAIVSKINRVGVDIEQVKPMIERIRHKFLSEEEFRLLNGSEANTGSGNEDDSGQPKPSDQQLALLTLAWSAKEAIYKWYGNGGLNFKKNIQLKSAPRQDREHEISASYLLNIELPLPMMLISTVMGDLILSYVVTE